MTELPDWVWLASALFGTLTVFVFSWRLVVPHPLSPLGLFHLLFGAIVLWRPALLLFGLDDLFPTNLHDRQPRQFAAEALVLSSLWLLSVLVGFRLAARFGQPLSRLFPSAVGIRPDVFRATAVSLTAVAAITTLYMWIRFDGPNGLAAAVKFQKTVGQLIALRSFTVVATVLNVGLALKEYFFEAGGSAPPRGVRERNLTWAWVHVGLAVFAAGLSMTWGARDSALILVVGLVLGPVSRELRARQCWTRLLLGGAAIVGIVVALRVFRDLTAADELSGAIAGQSLWRQMSVAANLTQFDALVLAVRDAGTAFPFFGGEEFTDGIRASVPGIAPDQHERTALTFAQIYQPARQNGWPLSSIGDWYVSLGAYGVVAGGTLSGVLYRGMEAAYHTRDSALDFILSSFVVLTVIQLGVWAALPVVYRNFVLPLHLVLVVARLLSTFLDERTSRRAAAPTVRNDAALEELG
jgi:hypothetical protein